jgi:hypothetical protein
MASALKDCAVCCFNLGTAPKALKANREVVLSAVKTKGDQLVHASDELKADRMIVGFAVRQNGLSLQYASSDLKNDKEIVMAAVVNDGGALLLASEELRNDFDVVLAAVCQNGMSLEYASPQLKNDKNIVINAVIQDGRATLFSSNKILNDFEFAKLVLSETKSLRYLHVKFKAEHSFAFEAVKLNPRNFQFVSTELKNCREIVWCAVQQCGECYLYASDSMKSELEVLICSIALAPHVIWAAPAHLKQPRYLTDFLNYAIQINHLFKSTVLFGCSLGHCKLYLLNKLGKYASIDIKKQIADYVGVCYGVKLWRYKKALVGLKWH